MLRGLRRSVDDRIIAGVCGGIAAHFGVDAMLVRGLFALLFAFTFEAAVLLYLALWLVVPQAERSRRVPGIVLKRAEQPVETE